MIKNIFKFDKNRCVGCGACVVACINENGFQFNKQWRSVHNSNSPHLPELPLFYLSLACNHCDDSPCLINCPALAYSKDYKTGAIIHHPEKCIGCKYCTWACPFDAPKYNPDLGIVEKCTFCNHKIEDGLKPACTNLCPTDALDFKTIEFSREESDLSSPVDISVGSNIKIIPLRNQNPPEIDNSLFINQKETKQNQDIHKISAKEELPLLIFTFIMIVFSAFWFSGVANNFDATEKLIYIGTGILASFFSMFHLGKKEKSWRSILNIKNSWLSKEILFYSIFVGLIIVDNFIFKIPFGIITFFGILLVISIDMLYKFAMWSWKIKLHYAQAIPATLLFYSFLINYELMIYTIVAYRIILLINTNLRITRLFLIIAPLIFINFIRIDYTIAFVFLLIIELILRIDFYNDLKLPSLNLNKL